MEDFVKSFKGVDELIITDIYPAGEAPIPGITAEKLVSEIKDVKAQYLQKEKLADWSKALLGDSKKRVFVTLGAGDIWKIGAQLVQG